LIDGHQQEEEVNACTMDDEMFLKRTGIAMIVPQSWRMLENDVLLTRPPMPAGTTAWGISWYHGGGFCC